MSIVNYIPLDPIINDWIEDNPFSQEFLNATQLRRWAIDTAKDFCTVDSTKDKITVLPVHNTKAKLPTDFHSIISVGYRIVEKDSDCLPIQKVIEYTQKTHAGCSHKISVECDACHTESCEPGLPAVVVQVDKVWEMENPWYYNVSKFAKPGDSQSLNRIGLKGKHGKEFKLMTYNVKPFHNAEYHVPNCVNINIKNCEHKYIIDLPYIETDILTTKKVELLMAYRGKRTDERGDLLIPDITDAIEAINYQLDYNYYKSLYRRTRERADLNDSETALARRDQSIGRVKNHIALNDSDKLRANMEDVFQAQKTVY